MNEWTVVTVIVALAGLLAMILKPLLGLNSVITRLTESVETLEEKLDGLTDKNTESHMRLWQKCREQDERLGGHETRLQIIEKT